MQDITWVESHSLEYPELRVELQPQRFYPLGTTLAHVLGYVGEISPKQLETDEFKEKDSVPATSSARAGSNNITTNSRGRAGLPKGA